MYPRDNVAREQKYTEQNQTEHGQVQHDEYVVHVSKGRSATNGKRFASRWTRRGQVEQSGAEEGGGEGGVFDGCSTSNRPRFREVRPDDATTAADRGRSTHRASRRGTPRRAEADAGEERAATSGGLKVMWYRATGSPVGLSFRGIPYPDSERSRRGEAKRSDAIRYPGTRLAG